MNCKPNDVAYIAIPGQHFGKIVRVLSVSWETGVPDWFYEGDIPSPMGYRYETLWDSILRPIRDPGDDAIDIYSIRLPIKEVA